MEAIIQGVEARKKDLDERAEQWFEEARQHIKGLKVTDEQAEEDPESDSDPPQSTHPRGIKRRQGDRDHDSDEAAQGPSVSHSRVVRATRRTTRSQGAQAGQADSVAKSDSK